MSERIPKSQFGKRLVSRSEGSKAITPTGISKSESPSREIIKPNERIHLTADQNCDEFLLQLESQLSSIKEIVLDAELNEQQSKNLLI